MAQTGIYCSSMISNVKGSFGALNAHFFQPAAERVRMEAKQLGRAVVAFDHPIGLSQRLEDVLALQLFERSGTGGLRRRGGAQGHGL